jgi:FdhD protein
VARADLLATEEPLGIRVDGSALTMTMRTPGDDVELAAGFLVGEDKDLKGWVAAFTEDGTFTDYSIGVTWRNPTSSPRSANKVYAFSLGR